MKHSEILKVIREDVANHNQEFICCGLLRFESTSSEAKANEILERIEKAMGAWAGRSVSQWLQDVAGIPHMQLTPINLWKYRLRWLDQLIAEYEEIGK